MKSTYGNALQGRGACGRVGRGTGRDVAAGVFIAIAIAIAASGVASAQTATGLERAEGTQPLGLSLGPTFDYSTGKYGGTTRTDIWSAGVGLRYETGRWIGRVTVPYTSVTGRGEVVPAGGGGSAPVCVGSNRGSGNNTGRCEDDGSTSSSGGSGSGSARRTTSGLGDVTASLAYNVLDHRASGVIVDVTGRIKIPTADETKGLGTGKFDYALQTDVDKAFGSASVFGTLGYRWYGDPAGAPLKDVWYGAVGASWKFSRAFNAGIAYDYRQPTYDGGVALREASLFTSYRITDAARLRVWVFKGLSDGTADRGAGGSFFLAF